MKFSMLIMLCLLALLFQHSHFTTILVDEVSGWKNPNCSCRRLRHFQAQVSVQPIHFPEPKSLRSLRFHSSHSSQQT
ncbi:hypothetical protein EV1_040244 [Malus domestica]